MYKPGKPLSRTRALRVTRRERGMEEERRKWGGGGGTEEGLGDEGGRGARVRGMDVTDETKDKARRDEWREGSGAPG